MSDLKGRHFTGNIILWAVRWYCKPKQALNRFMIMFVERLT